MEKNRALAKKNYGAVEKNYGTMGEKTMITIEVFEQIYSFRWYYGKTNYDTIP